MTNNNDTRRDGEAEPNCDTCYDSGWITLAGAETVRAVCPFCNKDGRRVTVDAEFERHFRDRWPTIDLSQVTERDAVVEAAEGSYHGRMMNIQIPDGEPRARRLDYKYGHKDARHAAAEVANDADTRIAKLEARLKNIDQLGVHLQHCNFGEHAGVCKYGDSDCPALTEDWKWFGLALQKLRDCEDCGATMTHRGRGQWECWKCTQVETREELNKTSARLKEAEGQRDAMRDAINREKSNVLAACIRGALERAEQAEVRVKEAEAELTRKDEKLQKWALEMQEYIERAEGFQKTYEDALTGNQAILQRLEAAERDHKALRDLFDSNPNAWYSRVEKAEARAEAAEGALAVVERERTNFAATCKKLAEADMERLKALILSKGPEICPCWHFPKKCLKFFDDQGKDMRCLYCQVAQEDAAALSSTAEQGAETTFWQRIDELVTHPRETLEARQEAGSLRELLAKTLPIVRGEAARRAAAFRSDYAAFETEGTTRLYWTKMDELANEIEGALSPNAEQPAVERFCATCDATDWTNHREDCANLLAVIRNAEQAESEGNK